MTYKEFIKHAFDKFLEDNGLTEQFYKSISSRNLFIKDVFNKPVNYWLKMAIDPKNVSLDEDFWRSWEQKWLKLVSKYETAYYTITSLNLIIVK